MKCVWIAMGEKQFGHILWKYFGQPMNFYVDPRTLAFKWKSADILEAKGFIIGFDQFDYKRYSMQR